MARQSQNLIILVIIAKQETATDGRNVLSQSGNTTVHGVSETVSCAAYIVGIDSMTVQYDNSLQVIVFVCDF